MELVSEVVGVVEEIDQFRILLVLTGTTSAISSIFNVLRLEAKLRVLVWPSGPPWADAEAIRHR